MYKFQCYSITPTPENNWLSLKDEQRLDKIIDITSKKNQFAKIEPFKTTNQGHVLIKLQANVPASVRGVLLLEYEYFLKKEIDLSLTVWCDPIGDKNSLRNLRGIKIKS